MTILEINELIMATLFPLAIVLLIVAATKRKDVLYYIPAFISLEITFICSNIEAIIAPDIFNLLEHSFLLITGILLCVGGLCDAYFETIRKKEKKKTKIVPRKIIGGMGSE